MKQIEAIRRKLRGLGAVIQDAGATEHERANAEKLRAGLKAKLKQEGVPQGDWTDIAFRLGRKIQGIKKSTPSLPTTEDTTKIAYQLGRALRRGLNK
jgi:plasmid stability protein